MKDRAGRGRQRRLDTAAIALALALPAAAALPASAPVRDVDADKFLRVVGDEGKSVALEIAARRFGRPDGTGPAVTLVGVVHIGERAYYRAAQDLLRDFDIVLYESVKPAGTGGAGGDTDESRVESTRAALGYVAALVELHRQRREAYPADLAVVRDFAGGEDPRLAQFLEVAEIDAWGRPAAYTVLGAEGGFELRSFGADGREGGEGVDADIVVGHGSVGALPVRSDDNIQVQLARALSLSFQLNELDYDQPGWRCSDMAIDEIRKAMVARGADFTLVEGALAGTSVPARIARFLLGLVRIADAFTDGAIGDLLKIMLIEMLGDEAMIQSVLKQFDEAFTEVIIADRNQTVIDDLVAIIEAGEPVQSVAVLYGAGHMQDMAQKLKVQLNYEPASTTWLRAIEVDLTRSAVTEAEVRRLRAMIRGMMPR